ncbi:MAG: recombinase family protein [Actinomycetota bacterium]|nr:recombinase family protein [Actinomycetota bacterium]
MPSTNGQEGPKSEGVGRVALYLRVSSDEQRERQTIETQRAFLEQYCRLYELEVVETYADDGVSGTIPLHERPEGRRLLEDAQAGRFETLLVYRLDRLGRSLLVIVDAHDKLQAAEVALRSATEPIDTSTPSGRLIFQMLASFAEYERETIGERTRAGLHRAYRNGKHTGCIPYGYDITEEKGAFVIVEEEAEVVRELFHNVAFKGASLYSEAQRLNACGVRAPGRKYRGSARKHAERWDPSTIARLLHRLAYSGTHVVNSQQGDIERAVPAIVEPELQQRAIAQLQENKRYSGGRPRHNYLLRGLIRCEKCGGSYVGTPGKNNKYRYRRYACNRWRKEHVSPERRLNCPRVNARWLEELVWADVRGFLNNPGEALERARSQIQAHEATHTLQQRLASLGKRLAAKQAEKGRYLKLYARGDVLDEEELEVCLADLKSQIENLRLLISACEADLARVEADSKAASDAAAWLISLRKNLSEVEADTQEAFEKRRGLVKLLVEKITVGRNEDGRTKVDITYRFGEPPRPAEEAFAHGVTNPRKSAAASSGGIPLPSPETLAVTERIRSRS